MGSLPRVVLVTNAFPSASETFIVSKFLGLLQKGWDVHVACSARQAEMWTLYPQAANCPDAQGRVHPGWRSNSRVGAALLLLPALLWCLVCNPSGTVKYLRNGWHRLGRRVFPRFYLDAHIIALRPALLHFEFGALAVGRMHLGDLLGTKIVVSFRGYDLNYVGLEEPGYYEEVWAQADAIHLLGRDLWARAQQRGCPPEKEHALIPPAIDASAFEPAEDSTEAEGATVGTPTRPLRILSVGRLAWIKGYTYALDAVRQLRGAGVECEYRIVGDGDYRQAVGYTVRDLEIEDRVVLVGSLPRAEIIAQMRWADVFLHAAVSEGFCNAVLEAQAMQLPVVCSDAGGLPENVVDGKTGFVVPRRDPQALAERLVRLAKDPALRRRMGRAGRKRVLQHFGVADQVEAFAHLYETVLSENRELTPWMRTAA